VFFSKTPSKLEVINDTNGELINFYRVIRTNFKKLDKEIKSTLHSRDLHHAAKIVLGYPKLFDEVKRAWAIWTLANQSYASKLNGSWGYDRKENRSVKQLQSKRTFFSIDYAERLEQVQIENRDALKIIDTWDSKDAFFYCDPPYINTNQGHYKGYTEEDFEKLLILLSKIKGKFLLSSYPSEMLTKYAKQNKWSIKKINMALALASNPDSKVKRKIEVLTANFNINE
jgi:DNA adenine methylase